MFNASEPAMSFRFYISRPHDVQARTYKEEKIKKYYKKTLEVIKYGLRCQLNRSSFFPLAFTRTKLKYVKIR